MHLSNDLVKLLNVADKLAQDRDDQYISSELFVLALCNDQGAAGKILQEYKATEKAGALDEILALEQGSGKWRRTGFEVRIGDAAAKQLPASFQQRLNLARAYLKQAPIMLFDEPGASLDFAGDRKFIEAVKEMKGNTTILIVTHRPSHIRLADKIVWLDSGHLIAAGPAEEVKKRIPGGVL